MDEYTKMRNEIIEKQMTADSIGLASILTIHLQTLLGLLLLFFLIARLSSPIIAGALAIWVIYCVWVNQPSPAFKALRENDDRFTTLLFYFILSLTLVVVTVGWRP